MSLASWLVGVKLINYCSWWWLVEDYKLIPGCLWLSLELESLLLSSGLCPYIGFPALSTMRVTFKGEVGQYWKWANQPNSESEEIIRRSSHCSWFTEKWFNRKVTWQVGVPLKKWVFLVKYNARTSFLTKPWNDLTYHTVILVVALWF